MLVQQLKDRPLRLALSGGGFRATLYSLGALLYLVDSGENKNVHSIYSVSGASILNGLIAQSFDLRHAKTEDIDEVGRTILRTITGSGLLFSSRISGAYLALLLFCGGYLAMEAIFEWPLNLGLWQLILGVGLLTTLLLLRGELIAHLLTKQFFKTAHGPTRLREVNTSVHHVFCATDLNSAESASFSAGGSKQPTLWTSLGQVETPDMRLDQVVRASAAFPGGIPPKRVNLSSVGLQWRERTDRIPEHRVKASRLSEKSSRATHIFRRLKARFSLDQAWAIFLADGGVWNNLGTDKIKGLGMEDPECVLVVDASAPIASQPLHHLCIPGLAELGSLARSVSVMYSNTVEPRIRELEQQASIALPFEEGASGEKGLDFPMIVRITEPRGEIHNRGRKIRRIAGDEMANEDFKEEGQRADKPWKLAFRDLRDKWGVRSLTATSSEVPTTFGRIDESEAITTIVLGYLATMTASNYYRGAPILEFRLSRFERLLKDVAGGEVGFKVQEEVEPL